MTTGLADITNFLLCQFGHLLHKRKCSSWIYCVAVTHVLSGESEIYEGIELEEPKQTKDLAQWSGAEWIENKTKNSKQFDDIVE